jgi:SAM-dependent methyltransferase
VTPAFEHSAVGCPCCDSENLRDFYRADDVPVNSVLQLRTREEALTFPLGQIVLAHCRECDFIFNREFDETRTEYSERYSPTQSFSVTFNDWHHALVDRLIDEYSLRGRRVLEIGCGKGEFLKLLCERGGNRGVGFDPAYDRREGVTSDQVRFVADFYSEKYASEVCDFLCCKMTLEHIPGSHRFLDTVRRALGTNEQTVIFFQVPDVRRILEETAFWDIYYEHCSYFCASTLARLFRRAGFEVRALKREYGDQYLMIEARPRCSNWDGARGSSEVVGLDAEGVEADLPKLSLLVDRFSAALTQMRSTWRHRLSRYAAERKQVVLWGSGSKGVAFLTTLGVADGVEYVVDINPHRAGHYMAKTGQRIVGPEFLKDYRPDVVVIMNPVYRGEIEASLRELGLAEIEVLTT